MLNNYHVSKDVLATFGASGWVGLGWVGMETTHRKKS